MYSVFNNAVSGKLNTAIPRQSGYVSEKRCR